MLHNPIPMRAWIRGCWMLAYRVPEALAAGLVPAPLELVTHGGFAFLNVVFARMEAMRPAGLPGWIGVDYWHVGYRLQVRVKTKEGVREGLHFLRSECDHRLLGALGNVVTDFRFHPARICGEGGDRIHLHSESLGGGAEVVLDRKGEVSLSEGSPFASRAEAEAFLRYNPLGLTAATRGRAALLEIDHGPWSLQSLAVEHHRVPLAEALGGRLELAFELAPIAYHFRRARIVEAVS